MATKNPDIRDRIRNEDVTVARSYLEVDVMEFLSRNEIRFGYEAFVIPSVVGPSKEQWDVMVDGLQAIGERNFDRYDDITRDTMWEDTRPAEVMAIWEDLYDKHRLQTEVITVEVRDSLRKYSKRMLLPDFAIYPDANIKTAGDDFDWSTWDSIIEVSGLWGVGLPGEATESDFWDWYRVAAVAFKELAYKLLGLWEDVYWVLPNQPFIEGVSDGIPKAIRNDSHYVIVNTTTSGVELGRLADRIGFTARELDGGLSPDIDLVEYDRPDTNDLPSTINVIRWDYDDIVMENADMDENTVVVSEDFVVYHGELGEVYISDNSVHVRETQWRKMNMVLIREYCLDVIGRLSEAGIVRGLARVEGE